MAARNSKTNAHGNAANRQTFVIASEARQSIGLHRRDNLSRHVGNPPQHVGNLSQHVENLPRHVGNLSQPFALVFQNAAKVVRGKGQDPQGME
jgi:hypothetical protein